MTRSFGALVALISIASLPLACGGSSKSNFDDSKDGSSASSSSNGDSSSNGSGGTDGSNSTNSGSAGSGGTDSSGSNGSGSGGTDSSGSGGSGDTSNSSGGTAGDASNSGSGGGGGAMNPVPSQEAVDACAAYCERKDEAGCENEESLQDCLDGCGVTTRILDCEDELLGALECSETANVTCNSDGVAEFTGCGVATLAWLSCVVTEGPDQDLLEPCQDRCAAIQEADCPNDTDSEEDCILGCTVIGTILPECKSDWQALMTCGEGQDFVCNDQGQAQAPSDVCGAEQLVAWACVLTSVAEQL